MRFKYSSFKQMYHRKRHPLRYEMPPLEQTIGSAPLSDNSKNVPIAVVLQLSQQTGSSSASE